MLSEPRKLEAAIALQLLAPDIPLIFMGEECGATEPFLYFTDHRDPKLAQAVREGRRQEFARFPEFSDEARREQIPDPNAPETFARSRPEIVNNARSALYRQLLALRREYLFPRLKGIQTESARPIGAAAVIAWWRFRDGGRWVVASNLGDAPVTVDLPECSPLWGQQPDKQIPPATTLVWMEAA